MLLTTLLKSTCGGRIVGVDRVVHKLVDHRDVFVRLPNSVTARRLRQPSKHGADQSSYKMFFSESR